MKQSYFLTLVSLCFTTTVQALDLVTVASEKRAKVVFAMLDKDQSDSLSYQEFASSELLADQKEHEVKSLFRE